LLKFSLFAKPVHKNTLLSDIREFAYIGENNKMPILRNRGPENDY